MDLAAPGSPAMDPAEPASPSMDLPPAAPLSSSSPPQSLLSRSRKKRRGCSISMGDSPDRGDIGGEWWSKELGGPVEIGKDFVLDTQIGGGDDFIFFPNADNEASKDEPLDRASGRALEHVQRIHSLSPLYHHWQMIYAGYCWLWYYLSSIGREDNKLLLRCGIKPSTHPAPRHRTTYLDDDTLDDDLLLDEDTNESRSAVNSTKGDWVGSMFKSRKTYPVPTFTAPSTGSMFKSRKMAPVPSSGLSCTSSTDDMFKSSEKASGSSTADMFRSTSPPLSLMHGPPSPSGSGISSPSK